MKKTHLALLVAIAVMIGFIISVASSSSTYKTFSTAESNTERDFQIVGQLVKEKPIVYEPEQDANRFTFYLKDNDGKIRQVLFAGGKPQDFERSEQIVLTGRMKGDDFVATKLLMKCPSKYTNDKLEVKEFEATNAGI